MNGLAVALFLGVKQENLMFRLGRIKLIDEFLEGFLGLAVGALATA
jgi:FKBP-type peptidyl-prolyl cis-trans isomerase (trigger factor)